VALGTRDAGGHLAGARSATACSGDAGTDWFALVGRDAGRSASAPRFEADRASGALSVLGLLSRSVATQRNVVQIVELSTVELGRAIRLSRSPMRWAD
jgi:hypothetical protein